MSEPMLHLAPHELAPNRRADLDGAPFGFRAQWNGRERDFCGQVVGQADEHMIFFALADEPECGNFVSAPIWLAQGKYLAQPISEPRTNFRGEEAPKILYNSADEGWGRLYFLDESLRIARGETVVWRLFLAQSGWAQWSAAPVYWSNQVIFRWSKNSDDARRLALLPPLELLESVRDELSTEGSDATLARQFSVLDHRERAQICRPLTRGSYQQWERVLRWYLSCHFPDWALKHGSAQFALYYSAHEQKDNWVRRLYSPLALHISRFCDWTRAYFAPCHDDDYLKRCSAAARWSRRVFRMTVRVFSPTQHERLEALLQLRDWLANKAAPAEIDALLRAD